MLAFVDLFTFKGLSGWVWSLDVDIGRGVNLDDPAVALCWIEFRIHGSIFFRINRSNDGRQRFGRKMEVCHSFLGSQSI